MELKEYFEDLEKKMIYEINVRDSIVTTRLGGSVRDSTYISSIPRNCERTV